MRILLVIIAIAISQTLMAQQIYFHEIYSTDTSLGIGIIRVDSSNYYISGGYDTKFSNPDPGGAFIYKIDAYGNTLDTLSVSHDRDSVRYYNYIYPNELTKGYNGDWFNMLPIVDSTGGHLLTLKQNSNNDTIFSTDIRSLIIPDDSVWPGSYPQIVYRMSKATIDGGIVILANVNGVYHSKSRVYKLDSLGSVEWEYNIGLDSNKGYPLYHSMSIEVLPDSGYLCGFSSTESYFLINNTYIHRLNKNGQLVKSKTISNGLSNISPVIRYNPNDGFIYLAYRKYYYHKPNTTEKYYKIAIRKMDMNLNTIWEKVYGRAAYMRNGKLFYPSYGAYDFLMDSDGRMTVFGPVEDAISVGSQGSLNFLLKLDANGDSLWFKAYDFLDITTDWSYYIQGSIVTNDDKGYTIMTNIAKHFQSYQHPLVFRVDSNGCPNQSCSYAYVVEADKPRVNINIYPNPASNSFIFSLDNGGNYRNLELIIYDMQGRKVKQLYFQNMKGENTVDIQDLEAGIYSVSLYLGSQLLGVKQLVIVAP
jgi:hypothetical protein